MEHNYIYHKKLENGVLEKSTTKHLLPFRDISIEKYNPTEDNFAYNDRNSGRVNFKKQIYVPFNVDKNTHLKGLKLCVFRGTNTKTFVVNYWHNKKSDYHVIGKFIPGVFTTKDCSEKLFELFKSHTENGLWIKNPKLTQREKNRVITNNQIEASQKKTINECIIEYLKTGAPRSKQDGDIGAKTLKQVIRTAVGFNNRTKYIKVIEVDGKAVIKIENKYNDRKTRKDVVVSYSWDDIFKMYPPQDKSYFKNNKNQVKSIYDSDLGKTLIEDLNTGLINRFIAPYNYGVKKLYTITLKLVWYFAMQKGYMGDTTRQNPFTNIQIKKPKNPNSFATPFNKKAFEIEDLQRIFEGAVEVREKYPFQAEALMFMIVTSIRLSECLRLKKPTDEELKSGIYTIPGNATKTGKPRPLVITSAVRTVLGYLEEIYNRPGYESFRFIPWMFPSPRIGRKKITEMVTGQLTTEDLRSEYTRIRTLSGVWNEIKKNKDIKFGSIKMFRKNYATLAKDILGKTGLAAQLTGHEEDATLDRNYYTHNERTLKENAEKVVSLGLKFAQKK